MTAGDRRHPPQAVELDPVGGFGVPGAESESSQQYAFRISHAGRLIAEGRAAVMLQG